MRKIFVLLLGLFSTVSVLASTVAGTTISNQASVEYISGNSKIKNIAQSNVSQFVVNELIDVQMIWVDASEIVVNSPDSKKVLTFKLTNTGNGDQKYVLTANNNLGNGNFNPIVNGVNIYIENGLSSGLQLDGAYKDTEYHLNDVVDLAPGEYKNIYLVYDIPSGLAVSSKGFAQLNAISTTQGISSANKAGTLIQGVQTGNNKIDVILGYSLGKAQSMGNYIVSGLVVKHEKTVVSVKDINGGSLVMSGSEILYQIKVDLSGTGVAKNLKITDTLPTELTYVPGSMTLNGVTISDTNFNNGIINVALGDQNSNQTFILQFKTKIN